MPVRSLNSSVLKWPDVSAVDQAARAWAQSVVAKRRDVHRIAYFGSYARGDWGVGSDLDLLVILERSDIPYSERSLAFDLSSFPVPAELIVYTLEEWNAMGEQGSRLVRTVESEGVWIHEKAR